MKTLIALTSLFLLSACGRVESVVGCYRIEMSAWSPELQIGGDAQFITPPEKIELTRRLVYDDRPNEFVVDLAPGYSGRIHRNSYWEVQGETVHIVFSTGYSGLSMLLTRSGGELIGEATSFWDFGREEQRAQVRAIPFECASHEG